MIKTLHIRLKDKHSKVLSAMASDVNTVWNYCNEISHKAITERREFLSGFDLQKFTTGFSKCEGVNLPANSTNTVCEQYALHRRRSKKAKLNWRVSNPKSSKRSLGWVPFKAVQIKYRQGQIKFHGYYFGLWDSYGLDKYELLAGSFSQDSRGRWYINIAVKTEGKPSEGTSSVGVDLGCKTAATCSDGTKLEMKVFHEHQAKLGLAQRAKKKDRVRAIHQKIKNIRKDRIHKFTTELVSKNAAIFVGGISPKAMAKTTNAKSSLDAGWGMIKTMLEYKCNSAGVVFQVVNEAYTTQTCSSCGAIPDSSPKGRTGLGIRQWTCSSCGTEHDRDINAAKNIAALGHERLAGGSHASR